MVDTIKFSQMTSGGDLANNETTPGLKSGGNVLFNNPWTFLAPGTTAQRPAPSTAINYRLRFNTDDQLYEYYNAVLAVWTQLEESAVTQGPFVTYTADPSLPDAQNLGLLANGLLKQTISLGIATVGIAVNGTDFYGPGFVIPGTDGGTGINNGALTINLGSATTGYVLTSDVSGNATWQSITASGGITSINGNTGSATPTAGIVVLTGSTTGLTFTGSGNTLTLGGTLALANGGTNANLTAALGAVPYSTSTALALLAPGTLGQLFRSGGAGAPTWTTATYPATAGASGNALVSDGTNWISSALTGITALGAQTQALDMNTHLINNVVDPVSSQDAATKHYVDQTSLNGTSVYAASAASLGTVTQSGSGVGATITNAGVQATFALDGVNPPVGANVLIKNTATGMTSANEGIYTVTSVGSGASNWVLTRATSYDTATEINNTGLIVVQNGATLAGTAWYNAATIVTVDTTAFSYSQFGNIIFPLTLSQGGTNASLTASNGGIFYSTATAGAILAGTATAQQLLMSGSSTAPIWSTSTYPTTNAINTLLYASSANVMAALATANNGVLVTSAGGVPSISSTLPASLAIPSPKITTGLFDVNNNLMLSFQATASAVNYITIVDQATGLAPGFISGGTDTNVGFGFQTQGTGSFTLRSGNLTNPLLIVSGTSGQHTTNFLFANTANTRNVTFPDADGTLLMTGQAISTVPSIAFSSTSGIIGTTTNDSAAAGSVGEFVTSAVSAVAITTATATNVTSISLTAGDWDLWGNVFTNPAAGTTQSLLAAGISTSTAAFPTQYTLLPYTAIASVNVGTTAPNIRLSLSGTTTVYLVASVSYAVSTLTISGTLSARRRR